MTSGIWPEVTAAGTWTITERALPAAVIDSVESPGVSLPTVPPSPLDPEELPDEPELDPDEPLVDPDDDPLLDPELPDEAPDAPLLAPELPDEAPDEPELVPPPLELEFPPLLVSPSELQARRVRVSDDAKTKTRGADARM